MPDGDGNKPAVLKVACNKFDPDLSHWQQDTGVDREGCSKPFLGGFGSKGGKWM